MNHSQDGKTPLDANRLTSLIREILTIADGVSEKDQLATAKLQVEVRQWVVEKCLLKDSSKRDKDAGGEPISVTINTGADIS